MVSEITGLSFSSGRLGKIANRIATLERLFNLQASLIWEDDTLPERFLKEPILVGGQERVVTKEAIQRMRRDYYEVRGWDCEGRPTAGLLNSLNLAE